MEESRRAGSASNGDEKEGARVGTSRHFDEYGKSSSNIQGAGAVERSREIAGASGRAVQGEL